MTTYEHEIVLGNVLKAQVEITNNLVPITGASPTLVLKSGTSYWNGSSWVVSPTDLAMAEYDATNFPGYYTYEMTPTAVGSITGLISYTYKSKIRCESHSWSIIEDEFATVNNTLNTVSGNISTGFNSTNSQLSAISNKIDNIDASGVTLHGELIFDKFRNQITIRKF